MVVIKKDSRSRDASAFECGETPRSARWYIALPPRRNNFDHNPGSHAEQHLFIPQPCFLHTQGSRRAHLCSEIKCYALLYWVGDLRWLAFELLSPASPGQWPSAFAHDLRWNYVRCKPCKHHLVRNSFAKIAAEPTRRYQLNWPWSVVLASSALRSRYHKHSSTAWFRTLYH